MRVKMAERRNDKTWVTSVRIAAALTVLIFCWTEDTYAYFDPGTGSMIFQALLAIFIGIGLAVKQIRHKVRLLLEQLRDRILGRNDEHE